MIKYSGYKKKRKRKKERKSQIDKNLGEKGTLIRACTEAEKASCDAKRATKKRNRNETKRRARQTRERFDKYELKHGVGSERREREREREREERKKSKGRKEGRKRRCRCETRCETRITDRGGRLFWGVCAWCERGPPNDQQEASKPSGCQSIPSRRAVEMRAVVLPKTTVSP